MAIERSCGAMPGPLRVAAGAIAMAMCAASMALAQALFPEKPVEWWMFIGPARIPEAIEAKLHADLAAVVIQPEFRQRLLDLGIDTFASSREASREFLRQQLARWAREAKALRLVP